MDIPAVTAVLKELLQSSGKTSLQSKKRKENAIVKVLYRSKNFKFQRETLESNGYQVVEVN